MWIADMGPATVGSQPVVTALVTTLTNGGACSGSTTTQAAQITTVITCGTANDALYTGKLYENGTFVSNYSTGGGSYVKTITGYVDGLVGGTPFINPSYTYRFDVVRNSDSVVVSTLTGTAYTNPNEFGTCGGPH